MNIAHIYPPILLAVLLNVFTSSYPATDQRSEHLGLLGNRKKNRQRTATPGIINANSHATSVHGPRRLYLLVFTAESMQTEGYVKVLENGKDFAYWRIRYSGFCISDV
jgi:hypothetical protein